MVVVTKVTTTFCFPGAAIPAGPSSPPQQLPDHARRLAARHRRTVRAGQCCLLPRLEEHARRLQEARRVLSQIAESHGGIPPAGAWLLDNYGLICDQIQTARCHLPRKHGNGLPRLSAGLRRGLPRVYDLAIRAALRLQCR